MNARQETLLNHGLVWLTRLLLVLAAWFVSQGLWAFSGLFQDAQLPPAVKQPVALSAPATASYDLQALLDKPLFGRVKVAEVAPVAAVNAQPEPEVQRSRLNVKLLGVISAGGEGGVAILQHDNKTWTYGAGEKLETSGNIVLEQIAVDYVIVSRSGAREKIFLEDSNLKEAAGLVKVGAPKPQTTAETVVRQRQTRSTSSAVDGNRINLRAASVRRELGDVRTTLRTQPLKLAKYLRIAPAREGGQVVGYSLQAGPSKELFQQFGLREGEVATSINGQAIGSLDHNALYGMLNASRQFQVELKGQDGTSRTITVAL